jgi:hypothetical protein
MLIGLDHSAEPELTWRHSGSLPLATIPHTVNTGDSRSKGAMLDAGLLSKHHATAPDASTHPLSSCS